MPFKFNPLTGEFNVTGSSGTVWGDITGTLSNQTDLQSALDAKIPLTQKAAANGVATLDAGGLIPSAQLPPIAITDTFIVASQVAMLALSAQVGDVAVRTDISKSFILQTSPPSTLGNWIELLTPPDAVTSVNSQTGNVVLTTSDITEGTNKYYLDSRVLAALLTGFSSSAGTVSASDSILTAFNKVTGNISNKVDKVSSTTTNAIATYSDTTGDLQNSVITIDSTGNIRSANAGTLGLGFGVGTYVAGANLHLIGLPSTSSTSFTNLKILGVSNAASPGSGLFLGAINGTQSSPTAVQTSDIIGAIKITGYGTSSMRTPTGNGILFRATEAWTNTATGFNIDFSVTNTGLATSQIAMTVLNDGSLVLNNGSFNIPGTWTSTQNFYVGRDGIGSIGGASANRFANLYLTSIINLASLTASSVVLTDASKNLVSGQVNLTSQVTGTLPIANGGTGQVTANAALNALIPNQTSNSGKFLTTNGTDTSWGTVSSGANTALSNLSSVAINTALLNINGVAATPAYSFTSFPGSGMYAIGDGTLGFSFGAVLGFQIGGSIINIYGSRDLVWNTDGGGSIGQGTSNRPNNINTKLAITAGSDVTATSGKFLQNSTNYCQFTSNTQIDFFVNGVDYFTIGGAFLVLNNNQELAWGTDGGGDIGSAAANRPNNAFIKSSITAGTFIYAPASGSDSTPTYSFTGDTNTGFYQNASDSIRMVVGGNNVMTVNTSLFTINQIAKVSNVLKGSGFDLGADNSSDCFYKGWFDNNVILRQVGAGFSIKEGTNATMGVATLSAGTVTVTNTTVTATSRIFLTVQGGTLTNVGSTYISARSAGTSFTISSSNILDASDVAWLIVAPA